MVELLEDGHLILQKLLSYFIQVPEVDNFDGHWSVGIFLVESLINVAAISTSNTVFKLITKISNFLLPMGRPGSLFGQRLP